MIASQNYDDWLALFSRASLGAARLIILVGALFLVGPAHASGQRNCAFAYSSPVLDLVADGELQRVEEEINRMGGMDPRLGADALALSIRPFTTKCREQDPNPAMYALLVRLGADVNRPSYGARGWGTSLMHAIAAEQPEIVDVALKAGARINVEIFELTPLILAIRTRNVGFVKLLLARGASANFAPGRLSPLASATRDPGKGNEILKLLIKHGARNPHRGPEPLNELIFYDGRAEDVGETVALLLQAGCLINGVPRHSNWTPLGVAMDSSQTRMAVVEALLQSGANPNGDALYRLASRRDYSNVELKRKRLLELLYQYGAREAKANIRGYPPLRKFVLTNHNDDVGQAFLRELDAISLEYRAVRNSSQ